MSDSTGNLKLYSFCQMHFSGLLWCIAGLQVCSFDPLSSPRSLACKASCAPRWGQLVGRSHRIFWPSDLRPRFVGWFCNGGGDSSREIDSELADHVTVLLHVCCFYYVDFCLLESWGILHTGAASTSCPWRSTHWLSFVGTGYSILNSHIGRTCYDSKKACGESWKRNETAKKDVDPLIRMCSRKPLELSIIFKCNLPPISPNPTRKKNAW